METTGPEVATELILKHHNHLRKKKPKSLTMWEKGLLEDASNMEGDKDPSIFSHL